MDKFGLKTEEMIETLAVAYPDASEEGLGSNLNSELDNKNDPNVDSVPKSDGEAGIVNNSVAES